jgi:hypothetical protein
MHDYLFLISKGVTPGFINDMWFAYWDTIGIPPGQFNDRMYAWLGTLGYQYSLTDRYGQWLIDTPIDPYDCYVDPSSGEHLPNWSFDCGIYGWGFAPAYPATITDNGDGSLHLKTDSNYGSLVPDATTYPPADWVLKCKVRNIVGTGKLSIRRPDNTWVNSGFYTADGEYALHYSGEIKEIHVGAANDVTFEADYDFISLREDLPGSLIYNNKFVVHNGEPVLYFP